MRYNIYLIRRELSMLILFSVFLFFTNFHLIAGGPPVGCTAATAIACSTPPPTCGTPPFNAGTGGSINCSTATPISMPGCQSCISGTSVNSSDGITTTYTGCGAADGMVWFTFVAPAANNTFTVTPGTLQNAIIVISNTPCGSGSFSTCNSGVGSAAVSTSWGFTPGQQGWIGIGSTTETQGTFNLCVQSLPPPPTPGNTCATSNVICTTTGFAVNQSCATASGTTPSCFISAPQQDTWISFTVLQSGTLAWTGDPNGNAEYDWALWNTTSSCPGTVVSCNYNFAGHCGNNFGMGTAGGEYNASINVVAGQTYSIQADNYSGNGVGYNFIWQGTALITPTAGFTMNNNFSCAGSLTVDFTHTGIGNANYNFGNGVSYTGNNPPNQTYSPGTYSVTATATSGSCSSIFTGFVTVYAPLAGTVSPVNSTCASPCTGSASISSVSGGDGIYTYLWNTGSTANSISNLCSGPYSVTISNATCGTSTVVNTTINIANPNDNPSFTLTNYCFGAANSATITGTTGGTFTFNPVPGGGVTINGTTGSISNGVAGATYTVQYTTSGPCPASSTQNVSVIANDNPSFTLTNYCAGSANSATITGTAGGSFAFNPAPGDGASVNATTGSISNGIGGTTYTLQYTTSGTCPASSTQNVTVYPNPTFTLSGTDPSACGMSDGSLIISGLLNSSNYNVSYMDNSVPVGPNTILSSGTGVITISGQNAGTYNGFSLTLNSTGCNGTNPTVLSLVDPGAPVLLITNPSAVCSPSTVDLTLPAVTSGSTAGTLSYWTNAGATMALATPSAVSVSGTYYIQLTNMGCSDIEPVVVTVNQTPNLVITDPAAVCSPATIDLTAPAVTMGSTNVGTLTYWTNPGATTSLTTPTNVATSGTYYIQANNSGCTDINAVNATINATPVLTITNPAAVCTPSTVNLTAAAVTAGSTNPGTLTYWNDMAATSAMASPSAVATSGTYYIQGMNSGCSDIEAVVVTVNQTPNLVITDPAAVCSPTTIDLTAPAVTMGSTNVGTLTYWTNAGATTSLTTPTNVATSGTYYIQANNSGCTDINAVNVTVNATPVLIITNPSPVCTPSTVNLTAAAVTAGSTNPGTLTYWNDMAATSPLASPSAVSISNTYYIQGSNAGCSDIEAVIVTVNATPSITNPGAQTICSSYTLGTITGTNLSGNEAYYNNSQALGGTVISGSITTSQTVWIYDANGTCSDEESFVVTINALPTVTSVSGGGNYCTGDVVNPIQVGVTGSANWTIDYTLNGVAQTVNGASSPISLGNAAGTYVVTNITDANCTNTASGSQTITVNPIPAAPIAGTDTTYCSNWDLVSMTATGAGGTITWYTDASLTNTTSSTPSNTLGTSVYYVTETAQGCEGPASNVTITIENCDIIIPTAFTPDGDGVNDVWEILDLDAVYSDNVVMVFNRWGNKLYESEKGDYASRPWDGTYNGEALPVGSYYFIIDFNEEDVDPRKGVVSIIFNK